MQTQKDNEPKHKNYINFNCQQSPLLSISKSNHPNIYENDNSNLNYYKNEYFLKTIPPELYLHLEDASTTSSSKLYLYLEDAVSTSSDDHNYYEVVHFRTERLVQQLIILILAVFIVTAVTLVGGIFIWRKHSAIAEEKQILSYRRKIVQNITIRAFGAYRKYAWGTDELRPVTLSIVRPSAEIVQQPGLTIFTSMSTLWVMDLKEEWAQGKKWIMEEMPNFLTEIRHLKEKVFTLDYLGGLLSAYALSGEMIFLKRALELFRVSVPSEFHQNQAKLVKATTMYDLIGKKRKLDEVPVKDNLTFEKHLNQHLKNNATVKREQQFFFLREEGYFGFQQPELIYFANLTANQTSDFSANIENLFAQSRTVLRKTEQFRKQFNGSQGLCDQQNSKNCFQDWATLNENMIDFYYNMISSYFQLAQWDAEMLELFDQAMDSVLASGVLLKVATNGHLYTSEIAWPSTKKDENVLKINLPNNQNNGNVSTTINPNKNSITEKETVNVIEVMKAVHCRFGGLFALSSSAFFKRKLFEKAKIYLALAVNITNTCYHVANSTETKLLPESFRKDDQINQSGTMLE